MSTIDYVDYLEAGITIFPLHPIVNWKCSCGNPNCEAAGKHPKASNWQHSQPLSSDQLAYLEDDEGIFFGNQLLDHFGVLLKGMLVVDVDGRNGGFESAKKLDHIREKAQFIVRSGSGYGEHWYFKWDGEEKLLQSVAAYPGIDFKSSGFVVGCHSLHSSGMRYEVISGSPKEIGLAPDELLELLKKPIRDTLKVEGQNVSIAELSDAVMYIANPSHDYARWLAVGMALHHATEGSCDGRALWEAWTKKTGRDDLEAVERKWHSFGKSGEPVTEGTLLSWAKDGGYSDPVTFIDDTDWDDIPAEKQEGGINLLQPPGLVGEITNWINSRCMYPRKKLAVAAALQIVGNVAGLKYITAETRTSLNLITIGVAGSRTGKGAIKRCLDEVHAELCLSPATHGGFKSTQELTRNAVQHQPVHHIYDEFGKQLEKLAGAGKGGAHYLEDLMATIIAMYSEATGVHGISGDLKREMAEIADKKIAREVKKLGLTDGENPWDEAQKDESSPLYRAFMERKIADQGIVNPYVTFFALTEPNSFNSALEKDPWFMLGGFMGRALLFEELENVPMKKPSNEVSKEPLDSHLMNKLVALSVGTEYSLEGIRIERDGDFLEIDWHDDAVKLLRQIEMYWREIALSEQDAGSSMESQALGATELAIKIAGILCADKGVIDRASLEWAQELIKSITLDKIKRAKSSEKIASKDAVEKGDGLIAAILRHINSLDSGQYTTPGRVRQAVGRTKVTLENVQAGLDHLAEKNAIRKESREAKNGRVVAHYWPAN